jgi:hypothetical protein
MQNRVSTANVGVSGLIQGLNVKRSDVKDFENRGWNRHRFSRRRLIAAAAVLSAMTPVRGVLAASISSTFTGGDSANPHSYNDGSNWNPIGVPNNGTNTYSIDIPAAPSPVNVDISPTISGLTVETSAVLNITAGQTFNLTSGSPVLDNGQIVINPSTANATTILYVGGSTFNGSGAIVLTSDYNGGAISQLSGTLTQGSTHSIQGAGQINAALTNYGTVNANGGNLYLQTSAMTNNNLFESTGGTLNIQGITITQSTAGEILSSSGTVAFTNSNISGGTLQSAGASVITAYGTGTIANITNNSVLQVGAGATLNVVGNLLDNDQVVVNPPAQNATTILNFLGGTVSGSGAIVLTSDYNSGVISQLSGSLTQSSGHTIQGYGQINAALTNNGTVNANFNGGNLYLQSSNISNSNLFEATGGGILQVVGISVTQNSPGEILAANGSTVVLNNATINTGLLSSTGTGVINAYNTVALNGVTNASTFNVEAGATVNVLGNLVDNGTITVNPPAQNATTIFNVSNGTVSGTGTIFLTSDYNTGNISQLNGILTQAATHTISGAGVINAALTNNGVVNADLNAAHLFLLSSNMSNNNLFEATSGGILYIGGIAVTQGTQGTLGQVFAANGGSVILSNASITNGLLNSSGSGLFTAINTDTLTSLQNNAPIDISAGATLNIVGNLIDNGGIVVNPPSQNATTILNVSGGTVSGTGTFLLTNQYNNGVISQITGALTQSASHSIVGQGLIDASLTNFGVVNASGGTLFLTTDAMTNNNIFEATNAGTLYVNGINVTQSPAATITAYNGSNVTLTGGAQISGGILNAGGNGNFSVVGTGNLFNVSNNAPILVTVGSTLNILGNLVDNGSITVNPPAQNGTTILNFSGGTLSGTGTVFLTNDYNNGITSQITGTFTQSAGHSIVGKGLIDANLTNNGVVNASGGVLFLTTDPVINNSVLEAANGGTLEINGINVAQSPTATVTAYNGSNVTLTGGAQISAGILNAGGNGNFSVIGTGNLFNVSNNAPILVMLNSTLNILGNLIDNGSITVNPPAQNGTTSLNFSGGTLSGTGSIVLTNDYNGGITSQVTGTFTQSAGHSIVGKGLIDANLTNNGTVNASGGFLYLTTDPITNNSALQATNSGTLYISGINVTQSPTATISAYNGSNVTLNNGAVITGGILNAAGNGNFTTYGSTSLLNVSNNAPVLVTVNSTLNILGNLTDNGSITVNPAAQNGTTILYVGGGTVSGIGTFILANSYNGGVTSQLTGSLTQGPQHSIQGQGLITANLINNGLVTANVNAQPLIVGGAGTTNNGTFQATGGGTLTVNNLLSNQTGSTITGGTYEVDANSTLNLQGTIVTDAAKVVLNGSPTNFPALAPLSTIASTGEFDLLGGAQFNTAAGITNAGTINISKASLLTVTGVPSETAGIFQVDGSLVSSSTFLLEGGLLKGTGTITDSVLNTGGILAPGDSPGTLDIIGNYNQPTGGELSVLLAGVSPGEFDVLSITGTATLGGALDVSFANGFFPPSGDSFTILTSTGGDTGRFGSIVAPPGVTVTYNPNSVTLNVVPEPTSLAMLAAGAGLLSLRRKRRAV